MLPMMQEEEVASRFATRGNKLYFISLGCPRNLVDTEVMLGILLKAGYTVAEEMEEADTILINTCGFLQAARQESLDVIGQALAGRKEGAKVIATGCMVQSHSEMIRAEHPHIDYMIGSGDVEKVLTAVRSLEQGEAISSSRSYLEAGEVPRQVSTPQHYAYLKIAEGCRKRCSYCIIPDIKGPLKSKPVERIVKEFRLLREQGAKEIILIAQDLGDWGKDLGYSKSEGLVVLLKELCKEEGDFWLRLLYLYPDEISDELIEVMKSDERICRYLDMPIQHVNDDVLKSMRRKTSGAEIRSTIRKLREALPGVVIRTSLIVGFPGETEEQFEELAHFLQEEPLDNVGVFPFSVEEGSHAATLPDQLDDVTKECRHEVLMEIQQEIVADRLANLVGETLECVVEGYHSETDLLMVGRHKGQCPEIDGQILINDGHELVSAFGERYRVQISGVAGYDLLGCVVEEL